MLPIKGLTFILWNMHFWPRVWKHAWNACKQREVFHHISMPFLTLFLQMSWLRVFSYCGWFPAIPKEDDVPCCYFSSVLHWLLNNTAPCVFFHGLSIDLKICSIPMLQTCDGTWKISGFPRSISRKPLWYTGSSSPPLKTAFLERNKAPNYLKWYCEKYRNKVNKLELLLQIKAWITRGFKLTCLL